MSEERSGYRSIMKATSIFGGVQVINIIITLIRGKAVAVLIGPAGMGLNGLFLSGLKVVQTLTSLGIAESAVRDLSIHYGKDEKAFRTTYTVFRRWIWFTAALGVLISILFAPFLSRFSFGDGSQSIAFMFLSATFIFGALSGGVYTVLRATRKISDLAKANIYGSVSGVLVTLPILYVWGIDGVMPSIIVASFATCLISLIFRRKVSISQVELTLQETFQMGKPMVAMGISISLSALLGSLSAFILAAFISNNGGIGELGLYSAGMAIMSGYVGMVFTAMSADYFPRLSQAMSKNGEWQKVIDQQAEILLIILTIIISLMMGSVNFLIKILLSENFLQISDFILIMGLSIPIKGLVWVLGYLYLSKSDNKVYFITELAANILALLLSVLGYYYFNLKGIAIAQIIGFLIVLVFHGLFISRRYEFKLSNKLIVTTFFSIAILTIIYFLSLQLETIYGYIKWILILFICALSIYFLDKRLNFFEGIIKK